MSFLAPLALVLSALSIPVILLYMLRLRRREVQVSSTFLWQQILRDREANAPWQKLRRNLLLLLQLIILLALVLSLARPFIEVPTVTTGRIALLIDASASMNATDLGVTRFEAAKQQANNIIDSLTPGDTLAVIRVGSAPEMVENYTNDWVKLREIIGGLAPSKSTADWNAALTLAAAGAVGAVGADKFTIILISDGGLPTDLAASYGDVKFIPVGTSASNVAITALAPANDPIKGAQVYARLTNYGSQAANIIFTLNLDGQLAKALPYTVPAAGSTDVVISDIPAEFHRVEAQISRPSTSTIPDYLNLDDTAWAVYNPAKVQRAIIFSSGNRFLEQGLKSFPDWQVLTGSLDKGLSPDPFDLYIFDGWLPSTLPDANMLIIDPPTDTALFQVGATTDKSKVTAVLADDPRTRYLKFSDVNIREFKTISGAAWAQPLVSAEGGPLILAGTVDARRIAVLSFALRDSDLPLKIAWPILLANLTSWYKQPRAISVDGNIQPGQAISIQPIPDASTVRVSRPDGAITTFDVKQPLIVYADTPLSGIYSVDIYRGSELVQQEAFAVNLFDPDESNIAVRTPTFGSTKLTVAAQEETGQREFWPWIALVALLILIIEWWVYHRRLQLPKLPTAKRQFARRGSGSSP